MSEKEQPDPDPIDEALKGLGARVTQVSIDKMPDALKKTLLQALGDAGAGPISDFAPRDKRHAATREQLARFVPIDGLKVGDAVQWKKGLRNARWPKATEVALVSQVFDPPMFNTAAAGEAQGAERLDMALAYVTSDKADAQISEFLFDSRRFVRAETKD